jgi:hypothetical protein
MDRFKKMLQPSRGVGMPISATKSAINGSRQPYSITSSARLSNVEPVIKPTLSRLIPIH